MKTIYLTVFNSTDDNEILSASESKQTAINTIQKTRKEELTDGYFSKYLTENTNINERLTEDNFEMSVELTDTDKCFYVYDDYGEYYLQIYIKEIELQD